MSNITRYRADDYPERATIRFGGVPIDLTGCSFLMTVNRVAKPADTSDQVFQSVGEIVVPASNGQVEFPIAGTTDPGEYFFDMEMTDTNGKVKTFKDGEYLVLQDITKGDEEFEWTPDEAPADGASVPADGTDGLLYFGYDFPAPGDITYQTRDARRVVRSTLESSTQWRPATFDPRGEGIPRQYFSPFGWELRVTIVLELASVEFQMQSINTADVFALVLDTRTGTPVVAPYGQVIDTSTGETIYADGSPPSTAGWTDADWYTVGLRLAVSGETFFHVAPEGDPDNWVQFFSANTMAQTTSPFRAQTKATRVLPEDPSAVFDLWKLQWRRI